MEHTEKQLVNLYRQNRELYLNLENLVYEKLDELISERRFFILEIAHRTKEVSSFEEKISKKLGKYKSLEDITDLCGFRIITYFSDTVDLISERLSEAFVIDRANSIDKRATLQANEFGYVSVHYICSLNKQDLEQHPEYKDIRFEIQLRSILQHAWAEIEHDLGYKSHFGIPRELRREFSRVAGLLEIADNQFIELRKNISDYEVNVKSRISNDEADDLLLDKVSLKEYVKLNKNFLDLIGRIKEDTDIDIEIIDPESYLELLYFFKLETLGDLSRFIEDNKESAISSLESTVKKLELDITTSNMILRFLCRAELGKKEYGPNEVRQFASIAIADKDRVEKYVENFLKE